MGIGGVARDYSDNGSLGSRNRVSSLTPSCMKSLSFKIACVLQKNLNFSEAIIYFDYMYVCVWLIFFVTLELCWQVHKCHIQGRSWHFVGPGWNRNLIPRLYSHIGSGGANISLRVSIVFYVKLCCSKSSTHISMMFKKRLSNIFDVEY